MTWLNYFVTSKLARLTDGHLPAENLTDKIQEHDGKTAYCCYFDLPAEHLKHERFSGEYDSDGKKVYEYDHKPTSDSVPTFSKYDDAPARPALGFISFDFDDAESPENSLNDVRDFIEFLEIPEYLLFFSGSKGFHLMVHESFFGLPHDSTLPYILRDLAKYLAGTFETLDTSIYNYNRKFRVPFSQHEKTGLYKNLVNVNDSLETIKKQCTAPLKTPLSLPALPSSEKIKSILETARKKSYEIETEKAGSITAPSPFEKFDDKSCIKKMLESRCEDVGRNNAAMRIVNDFYRTGKTREVCESALMKWGASTKLPLSEINTIISNVYSGNANYNFGCQDDCKTAYCTYKCPIYMKLAPDKRPQVMDMPQSVSDRIRKPKEHEVVYKILHGNFNCHYDETRNEYSDGDIVKQSGDLFRWAKTHWVILGDREIDLLKQRIYKNFDGYGTHRTVEHTFRNFLTHCPSVPTSVNMFIPNPLCINFPNGTLRLQENNKGTYSLEFGQHNKLDFMTNLVNIDYDETAPFNTRWLEMLDVIFEGDPDKKDKISAIQEMMGASLIPNFPRIFYLWGVPGSGKSTIMKILIKLLGSTDNISMVQPKHFSGFSMESMAGKLVNMVTDIDVNTPIKDDVVKQIEDRVPVLINRKFKENIKAPLPAVHIFGANKLVVSADGSTHSFNRRWSLIKFEKPFTGKAMRNIDSVIFDSDPQGLLSFAVAGLKKVIEAQGYFTSFEASQEEMRDWSLDSDTVGQFLEYSIDDEISLVIHENAQIKRSELGKKFYVWQDENLTIKEKISKHGFYKALRERGFKEKKSDGVMYFAGLGESIDESACGNLGNVSDDI